MTPTIAISIINYRTGDMTIACIRSARAALDGHHGEIVVVDNASGDGSAEQIEAWIAAHPDGVPVTLVRSTENTGFAGGHNQGIRTSHADFYLLLNSDAELREGFFEALLPATSRPGKFGLYAPQLEWSDGEIQASSFRFHTPLSEFIRAANSGPITRLLRRWEVSLGPEPNEDDIEWASFACILIRRDVIDEIGLMDDGYFLYYEDSEYCLRARRAGYHIAHVPKARAVHHRGGSAPVKALAKARKRLPRYYWHSRSRFLTQAHGRTGLLVANVLWHLGRAVAQTRRMLGKDVHPATEKEAVDIWTGLSAPLETYRPDQS